MIKTATASRKDWNIATLIKMMDKGEIDFSAPVQRGLVWNKKKDSLLVHTIMLEWPISVFYFNRTNNVYEGLEGKQRATAIHEFVKNNYKLSATTPPIITPDGEEIQVARKKFNQLPDDLQNIIMQYGLNIYSFDDMTTDEKIEFFTRINSGKPVSAAEIARIKVLSRAVFLRLADHPAIVLAINEQKRDKCIDEDVVENMWCMIYNENPSLLRKHTSPILEATEVTPEQESEMNQALDYMAHLFDSAVSNKVLFKKMRTTTHLTALGYMAHAAINAKLTPEKFAQKATAFFTTDSNKPTVSLKYNEASLSGSAKPEQVRTRKAEMVNALK